MKFLTQSVIFFLYFTISHVWGANRTCSINYGLNGYRYNCEVALRGRLVVVQFSTDNCSCAEAVKDWSDSPEGMISEISGLKCERKKIDIENDYKNKNDFYDFVVTMYDRNKDLILSNIKSFRVLQVKKKFCSL